MKKIILILIPFLLCGCSRDMNRREIDEINFIHVLGIDFADNEYTLSALYSSGGGTDPEGKSGATEEVTSGTGRTPYEAYEALVLKKPFVCSRHPRLFFVSNIFSNIRYCLLYNYVL